MWILIGLGWGSEVPTRLGQCVLGIFTLFGNSAEGVTDYRKPYSYS